MNFIKKNWRGILICLAIAISSWILGKIFPVVGGAVIAILAGMIIAMFWNDKGKAEAGIKWTSKVVLQTAVVLLGFGMNLGVIFQTGKQSLPIIICTITTSLVIAWIMRKVLKVPANISMLVGVGSSICGGSAIAAIITTICIHMGINAEVFQPLKELSKFLIIMAMAAIGLNSNMIQLIKTGGKPIAVGASCWCGITIVSLIMQHIMKIW